MENLGDLQPLAVKAGLNGVMMGNFLTTLGAEPEQDRTMFELHGLNVARQPDNAANPRPDNRSGWLSGDTPDLVGALLADPHGPGAGEPAGPGDGGDPPEASAPGELEVRLWDPSTQLRFRAKRPAPVAGWGDCWARR